MFDCSAIYDSRFYTFTELEKEVDLNETIEEIENYKPSRQRKEILRCFNDFAYFCLKYLKIDGPQKPFALYNYQRKMVRRFRRYKHNAILHPRQSGVTTTLVAWVLWRSMFRVKERALFVVPHNRMALRAIEKMDRMIRSLPSWLKPELIRANNHELEFIQSDGSVSFLPSNMCRTRPVDWLILLNAAYFKDMENTWTWLRPMIANRKCILASSVGIYENNWFNTTFISAQQRKNSFKPFRIDCRDNPRYTDDFLAEMQKNIGDDVFRLEYLCQFPEKTTMSTDRIVKAKDNDIDHVYPCRYR